MTLLRRWLDRIGFLGLSGGVLTFGFLQGFVPLSLRIEVAFGVLAIALLQATLSSLLFSGFVLLSTGVLLVSLLRDRGETGARNGGSIPRGGETVTAIVPTYGDAAVLPTSVRSLLDVNYDDLSVVIVTEADDPASARRAEKLADLDGVRHLVNTRYPGSKAGAINYAAEVTESAHIAVFDADEVVHPEFVPGAVARLAEADVVQGRTVPQPTGLVEAIAYYESILLSYAARRPLYLLTGFRMAASRAVVMRREAFEAVGGYDRAMLTEDFDFAYRCYRERLDVTEFLAAPSRIDAAHTVRDWWGQRKRWMTGYAQVLHKQLTSIDPTDYRTLLGAGICAGTVIGPALLLSMLSKFAALFVVSANEAVILSLLSEYSIRYVVSSQVVFLAPITAVISATAAVHLHDWYTGAVRSFDRHWLLVPLLFPLYGLAALKAVFEYLLTWGGEWYAVEKDPENL